MRSDYFIYAKKKKKKKKKRVKSHWSLSYAVIGLVRGFETSSFLAVELRTSWKKKPQIQGQAVDPIWGLPQNLDKSSSA